MNRRLTLLCMGGLLISSGLPLLLGLRVDELSAWLWPFTALIYLAILLCMPRAARSDRGNFLLLLGLALDLTFFSVRSPLALAVLWPLTHIPLLLTVEKGRLRRILWIYLLPSTLLFSLGALLSGSVGLVCVTLGIIVRKALVPLHQWLPELVEGTSMGQVLAFCAPQVGAYATVLLVLPWASESMLLGLGGAALVTSVYGACLALGQKTVRGAFAGLLMGQTALVFAGLQCTAQAGLAGGLALWISGGLALTGFGLAIWALEARRGPLLVHVYHGGHNLSPALASCFLILGLCTVGFPGTLGFVGQELLLHGTTRAFPVLGLLAAVTTTLNGITVMRLYLCLFCGSRAPFTLSQSLRLRERITMLTLVAILLGLGLFPQRFVASRWRVAQGVLTVRGSLRGGQESR